MNKIILLLVMSLSITISACKQKHPTKSETPTERLEQGVADAPTQSTPPDFDDVKRDSLEISTNNRLTEILKKYRYLDEHFRLMDSYGKDDELRRSLVKLQRQPEAVSDVIEVYDVLTRYGKEEKHNHYGEARWRAIHLLGRLQNRKATEKLYRIVTEALPEPERVDEKVYSTEYRIHARAINGLENLKAVELLQKIYAQKSLFSGVAAASLYELGKAPRGVVKVDGKKVLGYGDFTDFKVTGSSVEERKLIIPASTNDQQDNEKIIPNDNGND